MKKKLLNISLLLIVLFYQLTYSQYKISGYLVTDKPNKKVYLSVLRFDEESFLYEKQIITHTTTDSSGYFEIKGNLLPEQDQFFRVYSNISENSLDFIKAPDKRNYHNFIFSNKDTIFFPKNKASIWFANAKNTNKTDKELQKMIRFENEIRGEFNNTQNKEVIEKAKSIFLEKYKKYCNDSITSPLVRLLGYTRMKNVVGKLEDDYNKSPEFYNNLLSKLKDEYGNTSYFTQFREEIATLNHKKLENKYHFQKNLNYLFLFLISILILSLIKVIKSNKLLKKQIRHKSLKKLTTQEQKITDLILKGKTNKEIASSLFISLSTVKTHLTSIYTKLNVLNRQQVIDKYKNHTRD